MVSGKWSYPNVTILGSKRPNSKLAKLPEGTSQVSCLKSYENTKKKKSGRRDISNNCHLNIKIIFNIPFPRKITTETVFIT